MVPSRKTQYYRFGRYQLDIANRQLFKNDETIPLTQKSFDLLHFLIINRQRGLSKDEILNSIWKDSYVEEANLAQHIYMIRKALGDTDNGCIETIPKYGYQFKGEVVELFEEPLADSMESRQNNVWGITRELENEIDNSYLIEPNHLRSANHSDIPDTANSDHEKPGNGRRLFLNNITIFAAIIAIATSLFLFYTVFYSSQNIISNRNEKRTVIVLPFRQIGRRDDERLGLGLADVLISELGRIKEINVIPTESIANYSKKGDGRFQGDLFEIGKNLRADLVLTGSMQREGNAVRVNVTFYSVADKRQLCTAKFDHEFSDIFTFQDSISEQTSGKLLSEINDHLKPKL